MNWNIIEGKWKQFSGEVKSKWGKLTDDDLKNLDGKRETLSGKIQERYGVLKDEAEKQVDDWAAQLNEKVDQVGKHEADRRDDAPRR